MSPLRRSWSLRRRTLDSADVQRSRSVASQFLRVGSLDSSNVGNCWWLLRSYRHLFHLRSPVHDPIDRDATVPILASPAVPVSFKRDTLLQAKTIEFATTKSLQLREDLVDRASNQAHPAWKLRFPLGTVVRMSRAIPLARSEMPSDPSPHVRHSGAGVARQPFASGCWLRRPAQVLKTSPQPRVSPNRCR
jgi:hypothetical protein